MKRRSPFPDICGIAFVDEMGAATNIVQTGCFASPNLQLPRMCNKPDMTVMVLGKPLDLRQHLTDILCFILIPRSLMIQLVIRVNNKPTNSVPHYSGLSKIQYPIH